MLSRLFLKSDRRRRTRQLLNTSVRVFTGSGAIEATGINISDVGMGLFTVANLPVGSKIQLELPGEDGEVVRILATVRHRALYLYGIEFQSDGTERGREVQLNEATNSVRSLPLE